MSNPILIKDRFSDEVNNSSDVMTLDWAVNKSIFLVAITIVSAVTIWFNAWTFTSTLNIFVIVSLIIAFIIALIISFVPKTSPVLSPIYAILEWVAIWLISLKVEQSFPGIVLQAVWLTFSIFAVFLGLYKFKILRATEKFRKWVFAATLGIAILYLISVIGTNSGWYVVPFIHEWGITWIWFSLFVVWLAAFNLIIDFDNIEEFSKMWLPRYMEWYTAFGLLVTLVWLYIEVLRLLEKLRK